MNPVILQALDHYENHLMRCRAIASSEYDAKTFTKIQADLAQLKSIRIALTGQDLAKTPPTNPIQETP